MNDVTRAVVEAFPDQTEFIVMTQTDWVKLLQWLLMVGLPAELQDMGVLTLELEG